MQQNCGGRLQNGRVKLFVSALLKGWKGSHIEIFIGRL